MEGRGNPNITDERLEASAQNNLAIIDRVGIDFRITSPRPSLMHSERPVKIIEWWGQAVNETTSRQVKLHPNRFAGLCALPQVSGESPKVGLEELERCAQDPAFVG